MSVVYVKEQRSAVHKRGSRLLVEKDDQVLAEIPLRETELVAVFGNVQVSTQALAELLDRGIPVGLYSRNGRLRGRLVPESPGAVTLRIGQLRAATDPARAFAMMNRSALPFEGREKHPPPDPINALLSLGYTMVLNELRGLAEGLGLEPALGFLHAPEDNRPSLALDLLEPFRAPLVDRLVLRLVNERILTEASFVRRAAGPGAGSVILHPDAWDKYLPAYEEAMQQQRRSAPRGMRHQLETQVKHMAAALRDNTELQAWREDQPCNT